MIFTCRPADPAYHDDPFYTREVAVPQSALHPMRAAAELYCERRCQERSIYEPFDVQVKLPACEHWLTLRWTSSSCRSSWPDPNCEGIA